MKPRCSFILLLVLCLALGWSQPIHADPAGFKAGNSQYAVGDFEASAKSYEDLVRHDKLSANLFFNLGNADYRLGERGRAILNYRRALALEPGHAEAAANLAFVDGGAKSPLAPLDAAQSWWRLAPWLTAACGWLGAVGLLVALANRRRRALGFALAGVGGILCVAGAGLIRQFDDSGGNVARGVVIKEAAPALYSPADNSKAVTSLAAGSEVRVLSAQGAWDYVLLADGTTRAWMASTNLENFVPR